MSYTHDYAAFGDAVLRTDWMVADMKRRAENVKEVAEATAPYDPDSTDGSHYRDSFRVEAHDHGGVKGDRAEAMVINDDPAAFVIEMGTVRETEDGRLERTPKHRTLGRALDAAAR